MAFLSAEGGPVATKSCLSSGEIRRKQKFQGLQSQFTFFALHRHLCLPGSVPSCRFPSVLLIHGGSKTRAAPEVHWLQSVCMFVPKEEVANISGSACASCCDTCSF